MINEYLNMHVLVQIFLIGIPFHYIFFDKKT